MEARHPEFVLTRSHAVAGQDLEFAEYRHRGTSAKHVHFSTGDENNVFLAAFRTPAENDRGTVHVLEHLVLSGSDRFPVRDAFFAMERRSLKTAMNAFTSEVCSAFHFATRSPQDFQNLLSVYLDALFFPTLDSLEFDTEGVRLGVGGDSGTADALEFTGVVYNEMKAAMRDEARQLTTTARKHLFSGQCYGFNSGGDPRHMPDLKCEDLRDYHGRHYTPANAVFVTYGGLRAADIQTWIVEYGLNRWRGDGGQCKRVDAPRPSISKPQWARSSYAFGEHRETKLDVAACWWLGPATDADAWLEARLLAEILFHSDQAWMRYLHQSQGPGVWLACVNGLDDSSGQLLIYCGLGGIEAGSQDAAARWILDALKGPSLDPRLVSEAVDRLVTRLTANRGQRGSCGLGLIRRVLPALLADIDPTPALEIHRHMDKLRAYACDGARIEELIRRRLLDNPYRVTVEMAWRPSCEEHAQAIERQRLAQAAAAMTGEQWQALRAREALLQQRHSDPPSTARLPILSLRHIPDPPSCRIVEGETLNEHRVYWAESDAAELVRVHLAVEGDATDENSGAEFGIFCDVIPNLSTRPDPSTGAGGMTTGCAFQLKAESWIHCDPNDPSVARRALLLSGESLKRHADALLSGIVAYAVRFSSDDVGRLVGAVQEQTARRQASIVKEGHLAAAYAAARMTVSGRLHHRWRGLGLLERYQELARGDHSDQITGLIQNLVALQDGLRRQLRHMLIECDTEVRGALSTKLWDLLSNPPAPGTTPGGLVAACHRGAELSSAWVADVPVNYCAQAFPVGAVDSESTAALHVAAAALRNVYLLPAIRERGGAYGAGARFEPALGVLYLFSYRDPRLTETLTAFDQGYRALAENKLSDELLHEAKLTAIGELDRPYIDTHGARADFFDAILGIPAGHKHALRRIVLELDAAAVQTAVSGCLEAALAGTAVITDSDTATRLDRGRFAVRHLR